MGACAPTGRSRSGTVVKHGSDRDSRNPPHCSTKSGRLRAHPSEIADDADAGSERSVGTGRLLRSHAYHPESGPSPTLPPGTVVRNDRKKFRSVRRVAVRPMPIRVHIPDDMDAGKLISVVQEYEELYNLQHPEYSNRERREKIWKEIGRRMNQPSNACKAQWTRIRDNHRKALNLRKNKSGQAVKKMKPPKFHMELHFLTPFLTEDEDKMANMTGSEQPGGQEGHNESDSEEDSDAVLSSSPSSQAIPPTVTPSCHRRKRTFSTPQPIPAPILEKYHQTNEMSSGGNSSPDRLTAFFINMAETVKTFPLEDQIRIKSELFQIVNDVEMRIAQQMRGFPSSSMYGSSVSPAPETQKHSSHSGQPSTSRYSGQSKQNAGDDHKKKASRAGHDDVARQQSAVLGQEYPDVRQGHGQKEAQAEDYVAEEDNKEGLLSLCDVGFREYWHCPE